MRPTTTFLIPNVQIYFVFNLVNTTTNTDKRQQKRMSAIMMITAFKGLLFSQVLDNCPHLHEFHFLKQTLKQCN